MKFGKRLRAGVRKQLKEQYDKAAREAQDPKLDSEKARAALERAQTYAGILALEHHSWYTERKIAFGIILLIGVLFVYAYLTPAGSTDISFYAQTDRFSGKLAKDWSPTDLLRSTELELSRVTRISSPNLGINFPSGNTPRSAATYADLSLKGTSIALNSMRLKENANLEFILGLHQVVIFASNSTLKGQLVASGLSMVTLNSTPLTARGDPSPEFIDFEVDSPADISTQLVFRDKSTLLPQLGTLQFSRMNFFGVDNLTGERISGLKAARLQLHDVKDAQKDFVEDELLTLCGVKAARIAVHAHNWVAGGETKVADLSTLTDFPGSVNVTVHGSAEHILSRQTQDDIPNRKQTAANAGGTDCFESGPYRDYMPNQLETFYDRQPVAIALAAIGSLWGLAWVTRHLFTGRRTA